jgi:threonine/homoserine efflux transporter RhtA
VTLPVGIGGAGGELLKPGVVLAGLGVALLIPLLPYVFELVALRRLSTALFGVIMSPRSRRCSGSRSSTRGWPSRARSRSRW